MTIMQQYTIYYWKDLGNIDLVDIIVTAVHLLVDHQRE